MKAPLHLAKEKDLPAIGITPVAEDERCSALVAKLGSLCRTTRSLRLMLESCTKCGNCLKQCHSYLGTEDFHNFPAARADLVRQVYRRYFSRSGKWLGRLVGAAPLDESMLERWATYFYQCNECRRCTMFCPVGIDTAEITIAARHLLSEVGIVPRFMQGVAANMQKTGNNMGIPRPALFDGAEFLESEMLEETGLPIHIPVDRQGAEILYVPSSADFFTNVDTMIGAAKMFYALGADWTISSAILEAANFGLLFHKPAMEAHNRRLVSAARELGVMLVLQGECGHGWRAARLCTEALNGAVPFGLRHVLDFTAEHLARLPLVKLPLRVTLHDPCNYVRAGELVEQPRQILRTCVEELVEMTPNRTENFCCGGGSGILMDEMLDVRVKLGTQKVRQIQALGKLDYLIAPCSICKAQLPPVLAHFGIAADALPVAGVMDIVGKALHLETSTCKES